MTALFSFLELVSQLDDIGKGSYQTIDAFLYVAYTLPGRVLGLAAVSSLLGAIVGLGTLANTMNCWRCGLAAFPFFVSHECY